MKLGKRNQEEVSDLESRMVSFEVPMPPSTNALYVRRRGKRGAVALSDTARAYREEIKKIVSRKIVEISSVVRNSDGYGSEIYGVELTVYMPKLENPDWFAGKKYSRGAHEGELKVKLRYRKIDVDNRIKFLQDWVTKCVGMADDSIVFETIARKVESAEESVKVSIYELDRKGFLPPRGEPEWLQEWRRNAVE